MNVIRFPECLKKILFQKCFTTIANSRIQNFAKLVSSRVGKVSVGYHNAGRVHTTLFRGHQEKMKYWKMFSDQPIFPYKSGQTVHSLFFGACYQLLQTWFVQWKSQKMFRTVCRRGGMTRQNDKRAIVRTRGVAGIQGRDWERKRRPNAGNVAGRVRRWKYRTAET